MGVVKVILAARLISCGFDNVSRDQASQFYSELVEGLRPSGDSQLANTHPPPLIPPGTYDVGDGFLDSDGKVYPYFRDEGSVKTVFLRTADHDEETWAKSKCRKG